MIPESIQKTTDQYIIVSNLYQHRTKLDSKLTTQEKNDSGKKIENGFFLNMLFLKQKSENKQLGQTASRTTAITR